MEHALYHERVRKVNGPFRGSVALFEYGRLDPGGTGPKLLAPFSVDSQRKAHCFRGDGHSV